MSEGVAGDCFVVLRWDGLVWDRQKWVAGWPNALQFRSPTSCYEDCMVAAAQAEEMTGYKGVAMYIWSGASPNMTTTASDWPDNLLRMLGAPPSAFERPKTSPPKPRPRKKRGRGGL